MKILYVEDNSTDADLAQRYLSLHAPHFKLETVSSLDEAMTRITTQSPPPYDLVLTDLHLPAGDGISLLNLIRERSLPLAVVVITGAGNEETAVAALKAGADDYVVKRNDYLDTLPLTLESALHGYRARLARQARPLKVLYAEHSSADIDLTREHFKRHAPHIRLDIVRTGPEALERFSQLARTSPYHLILLDYRLPGMTALEVLKELQVHHSRRLDIPVVLVTGQGDEEVALQALKLGATSYVVKNPGYLYQLPGELENAHYRSELLREQAALRESEDRFAKAFKANPQPMSLTTMAEGRFLDVNESFLRMSGYSRDEVVGHTSSELQIFETPEHRDQVRFALLKSEVVRNLELKFRTKSGAFRTLFFSAERLELNGEVCVLTASSDITERKLLEQELRRSEREFSTLVENSPDIIARLDHNLRYIYVSPGAERALGVSPDRFIGKTLREVPLKNYDWRSFEASCREAITKKKTIHRALEYGGRNYWTRVIPELAHDGHVESVMTVSQDVTDRVRAEEDLRKLTARLFRLQDEERHRIARELHDGTAQNLFAISLNLAKLRKLDVTQDDEMQRLIAECALLGEESLQEIRTLSYLLHPPLLDKVGLISALHWYVEGFIRRSGIHVEVITKPLERLPSDIELALFRIVQESLTNVRRHSGSGTAIITLETKSKEVFLEIQDQGRGLRATKKSPDAEDLVDMGVGIPGMRQRLQQLGGRLEISSDDHGTTVTAIVPLASPKSYKATASRGRS